jgi:penicillin-binding protein 2
MFQRRLKVLLGIISALVALVLARAAQVQIVDGAYWREQAARTLHHTQLIEPARGAILDVKGRVIAQDAACFDAAVDYRAIVRDEAWIRQTALSRVLSQRRGEYLAASRGRRNQILREETQRVDEDISAMWRVLAEVARRPLEEIAAIQADIRRRVEMRKRYVWYRRYELALAEHESRPREAWFAQWLLGEAQAPDIDSFHTEVEEQRQAHVILSDIRTEDYNLLRKRIDELPGLVLRPGRTRRYPYAAVAAHTVGFLTSVNADDLRLDPFREDELRCYYPHDRIGRSGLEALCEPLLRGERGLVRRISGREQPIESRDPVPGRDVRSSIDIELTRQIEQAFVNWRIEDAGVIEQHEMYGAAVVIDVPTGQVRALVSWPGYDLNRREELYAALAADRINRPLLNRATQMALEPGSTVKPIVGIGAAALGLIGVHEGIECTGYLVIDGRPQRHGRCWVASRWAGVLGSVAHHPVPWDDPHPTGFLDLADAVQRSCNVYFETLAHRMSLADLSEWFSRFGLGRRTGVGIAEASGTVPLAFAGAHPSIRWFSAIGQSSVSATPIQMANVAATIARDGVWVRPSLLAEDLEVGAADGPQRIDLHIRPEIMEAVKQGMVKVVNTRAGSGWPVRRSDITIAGKTGTAQAGRFSVPVVGADGRPLVGDDGRVVYQSFAPSTRANPNPAMPWYRGSGRQGTDLAHAWFIGYAPAERPRIAFCVMVEYGGSGGHDAAPIVNALIDACIQHGYLSGQKWGH